MMLRKTKKLKKAEPVCSCPYCGSGETKLLYRNRLSDKKYIDRLSCAFCKRVFLDRHTEEER